MKLVKFVFALLVVATAGCGGGGGDSGGASSSPQNINVALTTSTPLIQAFDGQSARFTFVAKVSGVPAGATPNVSFDGAIFQPEPQIDSSVAGQYTITLNTRADLSSSLADGLVGFMLCADAACNKPYSGSRKSISFGIEFHLRDWVTVQRDAGHGGYVPITLDPSRFKQLWSWWLPKSGRLNAPVMSEGKVFVSSDNFASGNGLYAFDESSGKLIWSIVAENLELDPPAFSNGYVFVHARELIDGYLLRYSLWMVKAATGEIEKKLPMTIGEYILSPAPEGDTVFVAGASWGGGVSAFDNTNGALRWQSNEDYNYFTSPAATAKNVFYYSGKALTVYDRGGARVITVQDTSAVTRSNSSDYQAVPVVGSSGNVIALSGTQFSGYAGTSPAGGSNRPIVNLAWAGENPGTVWLSESGYLTQPALANGVVYAGTGAIYAGNSYSAHLDAIEEVSGKVLWSWVPPNGDISFYRNIIATKNLLFVSTDKNVYAIDLKTHQPVWQAPYSGSLALSGRGVLSITTGAAQSDGRVTVFQLQ